MDPQSGAVNTFASNIPAALPLNSIPSGGVGEVGVLGANPYSGGAVSIMSDEAQRPKGRMRVSKACDRCRSQKIKCSGTYPCSTCVKSKKDCKYTQLYAGDKNDLQPSVQQQKAKSVGHNNHNFNNNNGSSQSNSNSNDNKKRQLSEGLEDDDTYSVSGGTSGNTNAYNRNKRTFDADDPKYVEHLENRIQYLENLLSNDCTSTFKEDSTEKEDDPSKWPSLISTSSKWRVSRRHQNMLTSGLCGYIYKGLSEESRKQVVVPRTQYFGWNMSGVHYLTPEKLPETPSIDELSKEVIDELINFFMKEVNSLFAILHETVFREQVELYRKIQIQQKEEQDEREKKDSRPKRKETTSSNSNSKEDVDKKEKDSRTHQTKLFSAKLYLVLAIAIRFTEFQKPSGPSIEMLRLEEKLFKYSNRIVEILSFEWESFELIQSWLLISFYLRISHRQNSSNQALGRAITMTRSMGLGFESSGAYDATPYELLKAKRIFWCVYTFDRLFGLQQGRYCGIRENDTYRKFPSKDYNLEKDDWLTLLAFAMLRIARVSNFVHTLSVDTPSMPKFEQINQELAELEEWFSENDIVDDSIVSDLSLVKSQIKLHYYDLVISIHGKVLFNFMGRKINYLGFRLDMILNSCQGTVKILNQVNKVKLLTTPWYFTMLLLYNVGIIAATLINSSLYIREAKEIFKNSINLICIIKKSTVKNEEGKVIFRERFKMAKECLWALKMTNHIVLLRLQEDLSDLNQIGIDHGSADVNRQVFTQFGKNTGEERIGEQIFTGNIPKNQIYGLQLQENNKRRRKQDGSGSQTNSTSSPDLSASQNLSNNQNNTDFIPSYDILNTQQIDNDLISNLQWFDQWLDFNHDF